MEKAINKICQARICPSCQIEMEEDYVVRNMGQMRKAVCERCGKDTMTFHVRYTLGYNGFKRLGLL